MARAFPLDIPGNVAARMKAEHGPAGDRWLATFRDTATAFLEMRGIRLEPPFPDLSYAFVAPAELPGGAHAVFKAQPPHMESRSELAALAAFGGRGAVRLLEGDPDAGFALIERALPGTKLALIDDDDEATRIAAWAMRDLCIPAPGNPALISLERWGRSLSAYLVRCQENDGPIPRHMVEDAADIYVELLTTSPPPSLLHGDLHHDNVLAASRAPWLAIDPKGVVGDPAFEPGCLLYNPMERVALVKDVDGLVRRRLAILDESLPEIDSARMRAWAFARTVLSLCWSAEGDAPETPPHVLAVAMALRKLLS